MKREVGRTVSEPVATQDWAAVVMGAARRWGANCSQPGQADDPSLPLYIERVHVPQ